MNKNVLNTILSAVMIGSLTLTGCSSNNSVKEKKERIAQLKKENAELDQQTKDYKDKTDKAKEETKKIYGNAEVKENKETKSTNVVVVERKTKKQSTTQQGVVQQPTPQQTQTQSQKNSTPAKRAQKKEEVKTIDPFDDQHFNVAINSETDDEKTNLVIEGTGPHAKAKIKDSYTNNSKPYIRYEIKEGENKNLSNGDVVTVKVKNASSLKSDGYKLKSDTKTFTVEGLSEYITDLDQIDTATWSLIQSQCDDIKRSYIDSNDFGVKMDGHGSIKIDGRTNFQYQDVVLMTEKDDVENRNEKNILFVTFSMDIKDGDTIYEDVYGAFAIRNIVVNPDGTTNVQRGDVTMVSNDYTIYWDVYNHIEVFESFDDFDRSVLAQFAKTYTQETSSSPMTYTGPNEDLTEDEEIEEDVKESEETDQPLDEEDTSEDSQDEESEKETDTLQEDVEKKEEE